MTADVNGESHRTPRSTNHQLDAVYQDLRVRAQQYLNRQPPGHTLQPTALVHEAYLRLAQLHRHVGMDSGDFFAMAVRAMRSVLVDHARYLKRLKRGGDMKRIPLDDIVDLYQQRAIDLVALDEALARLAQINDQQAKLIELRFFGGLTAEETATLMGISTRTVTRLWRRARAWLRQELDERYGHDK